jgi:hypothetical protein
MLAAHQPRSTRLRIAVPLLLSAILAVALYVRLAHLDWDRGLLFHPDERQIMFVVAELDFPWPPDWATLLSPESPWNPSFFAYGSLPLYLLRIAASLAALAWPEMANARSFYLIGRVFSALADVGTVALVFGLGRELYDDAVGLLGAAFVALTVLHVQLSHFYAVDTLLTFLVVLCLYLAVRAARRPSAGRWAGLGVALGAALATKISAAPLAVPLGLACLAAAGTEQAQGRQSATGVGAALWRTLRHAGIVALAALLTFVVCQPYALLDINQFLHDILRESQMARGILDMPYTRQFSGAPPYLYLLWQTVVWSMGILLGLVGLAGTLAALAQAILGATRGRWAQLALSAIPLSWFLVYFAITGSFHAKFLRYMLPVIPLLCLWGAAGLAALARARRRAWRAIGVGLAGLTLAASGLYAAAYMHVFAATHPWIQATEWICDQVPQGRTLLIEHWDNPLPLLQGRDGLGCWPRYRYIAFNGYYPDDAAKLEELLDALQASDYIVLSSNRLYNSIPRLPERYPLTTRYYELLMGEELGFELVYFAQVYPELWGVRLVDETFRDPDLPMPRLLAEQGRRATDLVLGRADESYSVYDHPMPLIFEKKAQLSREELLALLGEAAVGLPKP